MEAHYDSGRAVLRGHVYLRDRLRRFQLWVCSDRKERYGIFARSGHGLCGSVCGGANADNVRQRMYDREGGESAVRPVPEKCESAGVGIYEGKRDRGQNDHRAGV